jgi:RNA polymerase sigma-70 factor (ECF subfamily)
MRRVLVNHAIASRTQKRGGSVILVALTEAGGVSDRTEDVTALDEALTTLSRMDARKAELVELRFFGGLTAEESAEVLGISLRTVHRDWDVARSWLFRELRGSSAKSASRR